MSETMEHLKRARRAMRSLGLATETLRNEALASIARTLEAATSEILRANAIDCEAARTSGMSPSMLDRLMLDERRVQGVVRSVLEVAQLPDPLGDVRGMGTRPNGIVIERRRIPLGLLAVVYEARPNVTVEAATLAIKSGNGMLLRGGKEARNTNRVLARSVGEGLHTVGLDRDAVYFVDDTSRERVVEILGAAGIVDLVIPRGGAELMKLVDAHARVPVIRHGQGVVPVYLDESADLEKADAIVFNAKVQRPGVCNAMETLLVHRALLDNGGLVRIARSLHARGHVKLHGDPRAKACLNAADIPCESATDAHWDTEFLSLEAAVRVVDSLEEALDHIAQHATHHTAVIVTEDPRHAERFLHEVDVSCVLWNASSRFNDGGELGLGAEIGISTTKMHAYGPMGLRELTAEKFVVRGSGQVRA